MTVTDLSLTDTLAARGLSHTPANELGPYLHDVVDAKGVVVFTGTASDVWGWLRTQPTHNLTPDMLGHVVSVTDSDIWGTLIEVDGDWATILAPPDATGFRRKDSALCSLVVIDPT
jgi:hypothetical protein